MRPRYVVLGGRLAAARENLEALDPGLGEVAGPRQGDDPQVVRRRPVEAGALGHQDLLVEQQVEDEFLVVDDVVDLRIEPREHVERALRAHA